MSKENESQSNENQSIINTDEVDKSSFPKEGKTKNINKKKDIARKIFSIQNTLRGASGIEPTDFKNYILGFLFYRFLSEDFADYINKENGVQDTASDEAYENLSDEAVEDWREQLIDEKGYFIKPSQLFVNVTKEAPRNGDLNEELDILFKDIEGSSKGSASEDDFAGLFEDVDMNNKAVGATVADRNRTLSELMVKVNEIDLGDKTGGADVLGDVYEMLIADYASSAGKRGGEFYTPQEVSEILVRLATLDYDEGDKSSSPSSSSFYSSDSNKNNITTDDVSRDAVVDNASNKQLNVYDPTCGSGSLLLKFMRTKDVNVSQYYGQELKNVTFNLARMNFFMHGVPFEKFSIAVGDTLRKPEFMEQAGRMDAIVANPPYSIKWDGDSDPILADDERFTPAGRLAPKGKADLAFVMHMLYMLSPTGTAAIVEFPTVLSRSGAERDIRKYLVDNDYIDTIIQLPDNLFYGTSIATCIIVLKKNKPEESKNKVFFVDASDMFEAVTNMNILKEEHQEKILELIRNKEDVEHVSRLVDKEGVVATDYTLSVNKYVEIKDTREKINIDELEDDLQEIVERQNKIRSKIIAMTRRI